ncbi:MAG: tetratricopeptide repeat protein [Acidobacteriaceae bacterium]|nr:tetratricopeptide repeat protein [Acidobacteriaceae bacterium]
MVGLPVYAQLPAASSLKSEALTAQQAGKDEVATSLYSQALTQDPAWLEGWWRYGGLLYQAHEFQQASVAFGHLVQLAPQNSLGYAMLGVTEYELQDWNNASLHLNKALTRGGMPEAIANGAMFDYGLTLMKQRNRNGALIAFRLLQHNAPAYPHLTEAFGAAELNMQQLPAAGSTEDAEALLLGNAAISVLELKTKAAETYYRQAIEQYPTLPFVHLCLALFLENLGRDAEAEQELIAETKVNQTSADPWVWLGRIALAKRNADEAIPYAQEAAKRTPNDAVAYLILGKSYILKQQWPQAQQSLQKAENLAPSSYEVHYALATVYSALKDESSAVAERKLFAQNYTASHAAEKDGQ